ncbi:hypothetical protein EVAR_59807_1 [Eumeta japonica]|uniref:Uncharacterized protein n=1 Tax=Eumeta variegata TaxID=151549 RepID=A0A4C1YE34_EUMVA|nr:hypothetical protein EVAR_59807_1 [Eumeta japonica]
MISCDSADDILDGSRRGPRRTAASRMIQRPGCRPRDCFKIVAQDSAVGADDRKKGVSADLELRQVRNEQ